MKFLPIIILILAIIFVFWLKKQIKPLVPASVCLVSGGVKTGKSTLAIHLALKEYRKRHFKWKILKFFLPAKFVPEEPLLYSNIPLAVPFVPVTTSLLRKQERFNFKSVVYLGEFSLVADSQLIRDKELNNDLMDFFKLFGHETHGGFLVADSQCIADCHYSLKRVLSEYYYIHHLIKWIPFILVAKVTEFKYSEDTSVLQNDSDVADNLRTVIFSKRIWKLFDCYCYSIFSDNLQAVNKVVDLSNKKRLKARDIPSFNSHFIERYKK